ncbi:phosphoinositide phospholipase C [Caerostris extrusa]|uniref:Phosphoinositide phospholipase C n=1 Tax=Caerostris extrusa TaxID=172846 RepID=A0AAV4MYY3_CAEEX|nr:phosphoinositide phospholipase C [Caerostris extrusa]
MAMYCRKIFGDMIITEPFGTHQLNPGQLLPSPKQLMRKIIIKNKKKHFSRAAQNRVPKSSVGREEPLTPERIKSSSVSSPGDENEPSGASEDKIEGAEESDTDIDQTRTNRRKQPKNLKRVQRCLLWSTMSSLSDSIPSNTLKELRSLFLRGNPGNQLVERASSGVRQVSFSCASFERGISLFLIPPVLNANPLQTSEVSTKCHAPSLCFCCFP